MSLFLLLLLAVATPVYCEELEVIEVTADKNLSDFHLGSSESSRDFKSPLVSEALKDFGGLTASQNGGPGGRVTYFIRGTEARHVSFTIDSLRINDTSNTDRQFDSAFMTSSFLKDITLYKGPQAVLFGSDAMGGVVDMRTRKGESAPETRLKLMGGSFGTFDSSLSHDWKSRDHQGTLSWSSLRTDGISRLNRKRYKARERDAADLTQMTSSSRHNWAPNWETDFLFSFLRGNNELDGAVEDNAHDESRNDQYMVQQKTEYDLNAHSAVSLRTGLSRHQRTIKTEVVGQEFYDGDLVQHEFLYNFQRGPIHLLAGVGNEYESFTQSKIDKKANLQSLFLQSAYDIKGFKIHGGLRFEEHSRYGDFQTGAVGVGQEWNEELFTLQYSQGFKAPSLYQLYGLPVFGFPVGNTDLRPERNHAWEASWQHQGETLNTEITFFQNRLDNLITYSNLGFLNQGRYITQGVEGKAAVIFDQFRLSPSFLHQDFKEEETPILRRPLNQFSLELVWMAKETLEFYTKYKIYDDRQDMGMTGELVKLNGFETADVGARLSHGNNQYGIDVVNVFDRNYEELFGYSVMPLSVFIHYGHTFR